MQLGSASSIQPEPEHSSICKGGISVVLVQICQICLHACTCWAHNLTAALHHPFLSQNAILLLSARCFFVRFCCFIALPLVVHLALLQALLGFSMLPFLPVACCLRDKSGTSICSFSGSKCERMGHVSCLKESLSLNPLCPPASLALTTHNPRPTYPQNPIQAHAAALACAPAAATGPG